MNIKSFYGKANGTILEMPRGQSGFGYDPIFLSDDLGKTFAEASREEKQKVSHRGKALRALVEWLTTYVAFSNSGKNSAKSAI